MQTFDKNQGYVQGPVGPGLQSAAFISGDHLRLVAGS